MDVRRGSEFIQVLSIYLMLGEHNKMHMWTLWFN